MPFEKAPADLKKMLQDSFSVPLCKLQVDENGKEVKRQVVRLIAYLAKCRFTSGCIV